MSAGVQKKCLVLDLDGTVYLGDRPIPGAVRFIQSHAGILDFYFLSNNTSKAPATYVRKLRSMGIAAEPWQLLSPTTPLTAQLRRQGIRRAYLVGNADYHAALLEAMPELTLTEDKAEAVILAYDTELSYLKLAVSTRLLQNPAVDFFATHPDLVCPDPQGPLPDVGSFIALYEKAVGRLPRMIFGKPNQELLAPLLARYPRESLAVAGDRLSTDKKLADNAGIDFVLVLSGEARPEDVDQDERRPWRVVRDLGELEL